MRVLPKLCIMLRLSVWVIFRMLSYTNVFLLKSIFSNSYTSCPPECGDNPRDLASGRPSLQAEELGLTITYYQ